MKAHELRIGNYVGRKYWNINPKNNLKTKEYQSCKIVSLGLDKILTTESLSRNKYIKSDYELIKHIPLTEEWLLNFDWNGYRYLCFNHNFQIDKNGRLYCNGDYKGVNIKYVHELQNLYFALTGQELKLASDSAQL